ncbi:MAG: transglutaminase domain-containing protein [Candidatus Bathyarchaeota archaeon]|nr:MAG: transglutaminase domain-containing protein [Candidatus Bathyarchaeota archaeon]
MRRAPSIIILLVLLGSLFVLSVLSDVLSSYPEPPRLPEPERDRTGGEPEEEPSVLLFKVSPIVPELYWRVWSADFYTGRNWLTTTDEEVLEELPPFPDDNATQVFTVEVNNTQRETFLPLASASSTPANISWENADSLEFFTDTLGGIYRVIRHGEATEALLIYQVSWYDAEIDDKLISLGNISEGITEKYLQLPNMPLEVWRLAEDLTDPSYSVLDQILANIQFLRTSCVYDLQNSKYLYERVTQGSDISIYLERRKGVCIDAATALAIILRIQGIPARISIGYKPRGVEDGKLLYHTTEAHSVTEAYLPPYGWVQFDATPPLEETPLVEVSPLKKVGSPGSRLFYQLSIKNRRNLTDNFRIFVNDNQQWNIKVAPERLRIDSLQTTDALLEVTIPSDIALGEKDVVTMTVVSLKDSMVAISIIAIAQVGDIIHVPTITTLRWIDEVAVRGDTFWINGSVSTTHGSQINNMTVFVFLTKAGMAEGLVIGKGHSIQGDFQIECVAPYFNEIGDYGVICISLGTLEFAPSNASSNLRVQARTRMELGPEEEFLLGYGAVHGLLLWDNRTALAEDSIHLRTTLLDTSQTWESQNSTSEDGAFRLETTYDDSGSYKIEAVFFGDEYILGSNALRLVEFKRGLPSIHIAGEAVAVRGEAYNMTVTVQHEEIMVWGEPITIIFDNRLLATAETKDNGSYTGSFLMDSEETLGPHFLTVTLNKGDISAVHEVAVKSRITLMTEVSDVAGGLLTLFSASVLDDHDMPVQEEEVAIDDYGLSWKTDSNGNLTFLLSTIKLWPANTRLTARFEGSELYLPAAEETQLISKPAISIPFLMPLTAPTLAILAFMSARRLARKRQAYHQISEMDSVLDELRVKPDLAPKPLGAQFLWFVLPDIGDQLPNVWGVKDKLRIGVTLNKSGLEEARTSEVKIWIDEEKATLIKLSRQGHSELSHIFTEKGEHRVRAILERGLEKVPWKAELELRVVEYQEEIVRLYNKFLEGLGEYGVNQKDEKTAREIQRLILRVDGFNANALDRLTACFEKAEYSSHMVGRQDYEAMYASLKELGFDFE